MRREHLLDCVVAARLRRTSGSGAEILKLARASRNDCYAIAIALRRTT